jgi:hypothetical protein
MTKVDFLSVPCPFCGAGEWEKCTGSGGRILPASQSHKGRKTAHFAVWSGELPKREPGAALDEAQKALVDFADGFNASSRRVWEEYRDKYLFSINFCRRAMGMSQEDIDMRFAEAYADQMMGA